MRLPKTRRTLFRSRVGGELINLRVNRTYPAVLGVDVCRMFNSAASGQPTLGYISTDHYPSFRFRRWRENLRVSEIDEVKSVPYVPTSHPFVERLIGTVRREYSDWVFFWNSVDLTRNLTASLDYYSTDRVHRPLGRVAPDHCAGLWARTPAGFTHHPWRNNCCGRFQRLLPG